ncbi:hypothetical protein EVAR_11680_1 [Eumeta japonica]|uniref:Uncharacterized protein n=1 Tax=Eumeta variegata TaxID=151549 RepID=A0A4C1U4G3_EUMVA|nr:hypothetical protein EVAR_11680_1 [Eumeta japonica]
MEIVLEAVVVQALGPSSGPEILIFKRFRSAWPSIDQRKFSIVSSDPDALRYVQNIADSTISFAKKQLNDYQPRDDYKELLTLTIIFWEVFLIKGYHLELQQVFIALGGWQKQFIALNFLCSETSLK